MTNDIREIAIAHVLENFATIRAEFKANYPSAIRLFPEYAHEIPPHLDPLNNPTADDIRFIGYRYDTNGQIYWKAIHKAAPLDLDDDAVGTYDFSEGPGLVILDNDESCRHFATWMTIDAALNATQNEADAMWPLIDPRCHSLFS